MKPLHILLVEDNAGDALLTGQVLSQNPTPIKLTVARDGEQALVMLANPDLKHDLVILDLNIPRVSGHVILQLHRRGQRPIVVFSSSLYASERERVLALGARDYVQKPTDLEAYKQAVSEIVKKWGIGENLAAEETACS